MVGAGNGAACAEQGRRPTVRLRSEVERAAAPYREVTATEAGDRRGRAWAMLAGAIVLEVLATLSLKAAAGLSRPGWVPVVIAGYVGAFGLLGLVLREGVPVGVAYGAWAALGVVLVAVFGALLFGEPFTAMTALGIACIIGGVLLVELGSHTPRRAPREGGGA